MKALLLGLAIVSTCAELCAASSIAVVIDEKPLANADLVIQGVYEGLTPAGAVRIKILRCWRGSHPRPRIALIPANTGDAFVTGNEYVVCAWRRADGRYLTAPHLGIYTRAGDRWIRDPGGRSDYIEPDTLTDFSLRKRIEAGSLGATTKDAELIASGEVVSAVVDTTQGRKTIHYRLEVSETLKGDRIPEINFVITRTSIVLGEMPELKTGQRWLVFLQQRDFGWYPFAGRNSLLQIQGNRLIYNRATPCPGTAPEILHRIRRQARLEKIFEQ